MNAELFLFILLSSTFVAGIVVNNSKYHVIGYQLQCESLVVNYVRTANRSPKCYYNFVIIIKFINFITIQLISCYLIHHTFQHIQFVPAVYMLLVLFGVHNLSFEIS